MELYFLKENFQRQSVIDSYKSLIWTERYSGCSDFVLEIEDNVLNRNVFYEGGFLALDESPETMIIETRKAKDGVLTLSGESLETIFKHRMLRYHWENWKKSWQIYRRPGSAGAEIVLAMMQYNSQFSHLADDTYAALAPADGILEAIPNIALGNYQGSSALYPDHKLMSIPHGNCYDAIKADCDSAEYGFGLYLRDVTDTGYTLYFDNLVGLDRTSKQTVNKVVRFEPALDSLTATNELRSISGYKNVCYVWAPNLEMAGFRLYGKAVVPGAENLTGFKRRTLFIETNDINEDEVNLGTSTGQQEVRDMLNKRARDGLANNNYVRFVDGTIIPENAVFKYGLDYKIGDIVELRTRHGGATPARVVEYIRSKDASGYKEYPTLTVIDE